MNGLKPILPVSTIITRNGDWRLRSKGIARTASFSFLLSLIIIGGVSGGVGGGISGVLVKKKLDIKPEPKPSPVAEKQYPYFTIGCTEIDTKKCKPSDIITVLDIVGSRYHLTHDNVAELKPDFWIKPCPGTPKFPFNKGDKFYYFTYAEDYEHQCQFLGPHWGWGAVRDKSGLTNSELQEVANVRR